jgi:hypothetical protein
MKKGRMVIEIEKNGDDKTVNLEVHSMTLEEICVAVGVSINNFICENTNDDYLRLLIRLQALSDISCSIGLEKLSKSIDCALEKAKEQIANEKEE